MKYPICESALSTVVCKLHDGLYGYAGSFPLRRCLSCGHVFLHADFSEEQISRLYSDYYPISSFRLEGYRPHTVHGGFMACLDGAHSSAFRWVPFNVSVLDIGCGFGETLGYHQARGCKIYGVDTDKNILRVVDRIGYKIYVGLSHPDSYALESFDYVTMDQVMKHVQDPIRCARD